MIYKLKPVNHTVCTSPTTSSNWCTTASTHHLQPVPTGIAHHLHITYNQFQPVYHTVYTSPTTSSNLCTTVLHITYNQFQPVYHSFYTSPTTSSNRYSTPSTHHLQPVPTGVPQLLNITYNQFQPVYHSFYTSPTRCIKTHNITTSSTTPLTLNNFDSKNVNQYPFLTTFVPFYCCNNITLKMAAIPAQTYW